MAERILIAGPRDVGKSTLARELAQRHGLALLDLDVGQGDLPGVVTLFVEGKAHARLLVGRISPKGAEGWLLAASARLARLAPGFVADTDGWPNARFRYQQAEALGIQAVLAFDEDLAQIFAWREDLEVRHLRPLPQARARTPAERRAHREARLQAHFADAGFRILPRLPAQPGYLFGLLNGAGFFLGYAKLVAEFGREALYWTPVRSPVARVVPTWVAF